MAPVTTTMSPEKLSYIAMKFKKMCAIPSGSITLIPTTLVSGPIDLSRIKTSRKLITSRRIQKRRCISCTS